MGHHARIAPNCEWMVASPKMAAVSDNGCETAFWKLCRAFRLTLATFQKPTFNRE
jgi:hypothetical protein